MDKRNLMMTIAFIALIGILLWAMGGKDTKDTKTQPQFQTNQNPGSQPNNSLGKAAYVKFLDHRKGYIDMNDYKGKVIILDFWATWCPPCKAEIPFFIELQNQYGKDGLVILGAAIDDQNKVRTFYRQYKINYPVGMADNAMQKAYGWIRGFPTTFVIDREGNIVRKYVGFRPKQVFENDFLALK